MLVGWSDGTETPEQKKYFNIGFVNSTLVISAWESDRLIEAVRVLSDIIFRNRTRTSKTVYRTLFRLRVVSWNNRENIRLQIV